MDTRISRRGLLAGAGAMAVETSARAEPDHGPVRQQFPAQFLWGAATAGHQVEGQNTNSDVWCLEHVKPTLFSESSGDACDSFNRWPHDMDIVRALGLNTYRFSLEWARIEPSEGEFSAAMLDHYRKMIAGCRKRGLTPMVTFNHFSAPRWFAAKGGWQVATAPDQFTRFCDVAARALAADIGYASTMNEPNITRLLRWLKLPNVGGVIAAQQGMLQAAARACGSPLFSAANAGDPDVMLPHLLAGHAQAYQAIKAVVPTLPVGVSLALLDDQAVGDPARRDAKRRDVYEAWLHAAREHADFVGVQNYSRVRYDANGEMPLPAGAQLDQGGGEIFPASLEGTIRYAHAATGKPIIVTENGVGTLDDSVRAAYIPEALAGVHRAIADGIPVGGYVHWSLLDNFEWLFGYKVKYGLCTVDFATQQRTPKPSAHVYGAIARRNGLG